MCNKRYSFGRGDDKSIPILFPLNNDSLPSTENIDLANPNGILHQILKEKRDSTIDEPLHNLNSNFDYQ
jgi:hypothetical protein